LYPYLSAPEATQKHKNSHSCVSSPLPAYELAEQDSSLEPTKATTSPGEVLAWNRQKSVFPGSVRATVRPDIFNVFNLVNLGCLMSASTVTSALPGGLQTMSLNNAPQRQVQFAVRLEL
jgi:hypothetical protein